MTQTSATVSWGAATDPNGDPITYTLEYQKDDANPFWTSECETSGTTCQLSGLMEDKSYHVRVRASDGPLTSNWRTQNNLFSTLPIPVIDASLSVSSVVPDPVQAGSTTTINLSVTNTGNVSHTFQFSVEILDYDDTSIVDQPLLQQVTITPGAIKSVAAPVLIPAHALSGPYKAVCHVWENAPGTGVALASSEKDFGVTYNPPSPIPWGNNTQPYGVFDDLASRTYDGDRHDDPAYRYFFCRRGVLQENDYVAGLEDDANLGFSPRTGANRQGELFLMRSPPHFGDDVVINPAYPEDCFRAGGELIAWDCPNLVGKFTWNADELVIRDVPKDWNYHLFRRLHPQESAPTISKTKLIVLVHGWNPDSVPNPFGGASWAQVSANIGQWLSTNGKTDWQVVEYNWAADADTGPTLGANPGFKDAFPKSGSESESAPKGVDTWPNQNGTEAAEAAHLHGQYLGEHLADQPGIEKVQFIAHSAGTWCARTAARYLLRQPNIEVQVTLLDPFMPNNAGAGDIPEPAESVLGKTIIDELDTEGSHPVLLENYFSKWDKIGGPAFFYNLGTSQQFAWRLLDIQEQLDDTIGNLIVVGRYTDHSGPVLFYAETVNESVQSETFWNWNWREAGWFVSLPYQELAEVDTTNPTVTITDPPNGQTVHTATISVSGTASDPGSPSTGVVAVEVRVNGGGWQLANGTTNWNVPSISLNVGGNTIEARSRDGADNPSTLSSVSVTYQIPPTWYQDADNDGYGNQFVSVQSPTQPSGYVADDTDCDDTRPDVNPGAVEQCGNGVDEDCKDGDLPCDPCGDTDCDFNGGENPCSCPEDCGPEIPEEGACDDQIDNDCNGIVDDCDPLLINAALRRFHGGAGDLDVPLHINGTPAIDPRRADAGGPQLVLTYDGTPTDPGCGGVQVSNGNCAATSVDGNALLVDLVHASNSCVEVGIGPNTIRVLSHEANVNTDNDVNILDLQEIKNRLLQAVQTSTAGYDVNCDGGINILDLQAAKNNLQQPASCP